MIRRFENVAILLALTGFAAGCATSPWEPLAGGDALDRPTLTPPLVTPGKRVADAQLPGVDQQRAGSLLAPEAVATTQPSTAPPNSPSMNDVLAELQSVGAIDPAAQQRLMADLQQTDPALWPQMLQIFKATLAYQQQMPGGASQAPPTAVAAASGPQPVTVEAGQGVAPASFQAQAGPPQNVAQAGGTAAGEAPPFTPNVEVATPTAPPLRAPEAAMIEPLPPASEQPANVAQVQPGVPASPNAPVQVAVSTETPAGPTNPQASTVTQAAAVGDAQTASLAVATSDVAMSGDWQANLQNAITALEAQLGDSPHNDDDIRRQATLRMLHLAAGNTEEAVTPINGISPLQQDFWAKQMYGLGAMLDSEGHPRVDQRAAEAAMHLVEANTRLGEMAQLVVRNLNFCTEVTSFGVYQPFAETKFSAGQEVLLYAEIENFKSEQTEKGWHSSLRSSYEILDPQGHRVADHEFAVTQDNCRNQRRDFFILYNLFMPERIYPGTYTLQLTIEDALSNKIGQSSIDFEIE